MKRRLLLASGLVCVAATLGSVFAWGYLAHRDRVFPYWAVRSFMDRRDMHPPWQKEVRPVSLPGAPPAELAALVELGYVEGTVDVERERSGVYVHEPAAYDGLTLYFSRSSRGAALLDLAGREVHRWVNEERLPWRYVEVVADGSILVNYSDGALAKLDRDSKPLWRVADRFHHRIAVAPDGSIRALAHRIRVDPRIHPTLPIIDDDVVVIDAEGHVVRQHGLADLMLGSPLAFLVPSPGLAGLDRGNALDVLHANDVDVLSGDDPVWGEGNLLLSFRTMSLVVVTDPEASRVLWSWGPGTLTYQHDPSYVDGNLLVFDNGTRQSRLLEIDPHSFDVRWQYGPNKGFFTRTRGSSQRLPNGNTLVIESDSGYAFEVTQDGKTVWAFANPEIDDKGLREALWSLRRLSAAEVPWLREATGGLPLEPTGS